jgi:O-antigen/teichoic acid export membrane protein
VALPRLSQLSGDEEARRAMTPLLTRLTLLVTAMVALLLAAIAYPLVLLLFGEEFRDAILPLLILLPGIVAGAASRILANDIAARGRPELNMYMSVFTVSFNVSGNILLIPMYGLLGAALATAMAYSLNLVLRLFIYRRQTGISPRDVVLAKLADLAAVKMMLRPVR